MGNDITKEELKALVNEVKEFKGSVMAKVLELKRAEYKDATATMAVYDQKTIAQREYFRGMVGGLSLVLDDFDAYIDTLDKLLQKEEK